MNFFGEKPSSRVIKPPGGGSSNIFCGSDDASTTISNSPKVKPTFQSSIFNTNPEPAQPRPSSRPGNSTANNIFGSPDTADSNSATSPQKISKTHQSSIFAEPATVPEQQKKAVRRDPITGVEVEEDKQATNGTKEEKKEANNQNDDKTQEPHLGTVKNSSGVRCAQPPGGKSSISFG